MIQRFLFVLLMAFGLAPLAMQAQPVNDECAGAIELTPGAACTPVAGDVDGSTQSIPGPAFCDGFNATPDDDVWYRFTATATDHLILVQGSSSFDAVIQLRGGACNGAPIDCQDVVGAGGLEVLEATGLTVGTEYLVRVFSYGATLPATTTFTICITTGTVPPNDNCAGAIALTPSETCNPVAGTTENATASIAGLVTCSGNLANPNDDVWYSFVATSIDHTVIVAPSASFDAVIQLRDGSGGCNGAPLNCQNAGGAGVTEAMSLAGLTIGETYYLRVFHFEAIAPATHTFTICVTTGLALPNDACTDAIVLTPGAVCDPVTGTTQNATESIAGLVDCSGNLANANDDVWYAFVATATEHTVTVVPSASFNAAVQLRDGSGGCNGSPITCQDAAGTGQTEVMNLTGLTIGGTYFLRVFHYEAIAPATHTFTICITNGLVPANDECANAIELIPDPICNPVAGTTENATASIAGLVSCSGFLGNPNDDVWYRFVATATEHVVNVGVSAGFDPVVQLRDGATGCNGTPIVCYADGATGVGVSLNFTGLTIGNTYYLRVFHYAAAAPTTHTFTICVLGPAPATCDADASTLSPNRPEVCFEDGPTLIDAAFNDLPTVPVGYEVLHILTSGPDLIIQQTSADPAFFVDALGDYIIHSLVYDPNTLDLSGVVPGVTQASEILAQLIQGGGTICGSLDVAGAPVSVIECLECEANAGTITADNDIVCLDGGAADLAATPDGNAVVPDGYTVLYVLTTGVDLVILDANADPSFTVIAAGEYTIHTLVYHPDSLDLQIIVPGVTTGGDVLQYINDNQLCASLDVIGASIQVIDCSGPCDAEAGTVTATADTVCFDLDQNLAVISASPNGDAVVPPGYELVYALTQGPDLVIVDGESNPEFTVFAPGTYTIHAFVFTSATLDLGIVEFGVTTAADLLQYIADEGICASLDAVGAPIVVEYCIECDADAGTLTIDESPVCLMMGEAQVGATHGILPSVPSGYETAYVLTEGAGLTIVALSGGPVFTVSAPGSYTIHTIVYDPSTIDPGLIELGVTTGFDINALLVQGGGIICGALDVAGAPVTVNDCSPANDDCISAAPLGINLVDDCPANAVSGDNTYADMDGSVPSCDDEGSYLFDVWYTFNAGENEEVTLNFDPGTMEDWAIAIFDACGGNELGCYLMPTDPIVVATSAFTDYVVQVYSNFTFGNGGAFSICLTGETPTVVCDGGLVQTSGGQFSVDVCQDTEADVIDFITSSTSGEQYSFLLTDDNDAIITVLVGGSLDFNSAPMGLYRVWGVSHNGDLVGAEPGLSAIDITSTGTCVSLSSNYVLVNVDICDGLNGPSNTPWSLFPNPSNGDFSLVGPVNGAVEVTVIDLRGRTVHQERALVARGQVHGLNLSDRLAPGTYAVRVLGEGEATTLRWVVR
ncbi:MAG: T9SS type A sorting domain-containing protein [Flavobacteriales bacterium]|nr:T9SS type A sorting domain-containing protein [Flavobacteriales bacterium]